MNLHALLMLAVVIAADNETTARTIAASSTESSSSATTTRLNLHGGHAKDARSAAATTDADDGARSHLRHLTKVNISLVHFGYIILKAIVINKLKHG